MKRKLFVSAFFLSLCFWSYSQINLEDEQMKGSKLVLMPNFIYVYEVNYEGTEYDLIITVKSISDGIEFEYKMTNDAETKGSVSMSSEALENAIKQINYFSGGQLDLTDKTTVWVSKKVFNDLVLSGSATISPDEGKTMIELINAEAGHDFNIYNAISNMEFNDISYVYAESKDGKVKYWIHLSQNNPMILKMDLGWTVTLKEIRKVK